MASLYTAGRIRVAKNSTKVYGTDTEWLINDIKANDLILINLELHEILSVTSSVELVLSEAYTGESLENANYLIIHISAQVFAAKVAKQIQEIIDKYSSRETEIVTKLKEYDPYIKIVKLFGLYLDEDGDWAQDPEKGGSVLPDDFPVASSEDIQELLDELGFDGK